MTPTTPGRRIIHHATRLLVHPHDMARQAAPIYISGSSLHNLQLKLYASLLPLYSTYPIWLYQHARLAFSSHRLVLRLARLIGTSGADLGGRIDLVFFLVSLLRRHGHYPTPATVAALPRCSSCASYTRCNRAASSERPLTFWESSLLSHHTHVIVRLLQSAQQCFCVLCGSL